MIQIKEVTTRLANVIYVLTCRMRNMMRSGTMTATNIGVLQEIMMIVDTTGDTVAIQFYKGKNMTINKFQKRKNTDEVTFVWQCALDTLLITMLERHEGYFVNKGKPQRMTQMARVKTCSCSLLNKHAQYQQST